MSAPRLGPPARAEFVARQRRLLDVVEADGLDGLIVWARGGTNADAHGDVLYLANHVTPTSHLPDRQSGSASGHCAFVARPGRDAILVTDAYDATPDDVVVDELRTEFHVARGTVAAARDLGLAGKRIGIVGARSLLYAAYQELAAGLDASFVWLDHALTALRAVKSEHEIALLREASAIGGAWVDAMLAALEAGRTDADVVGSGLEYFASVGGWPMDVAIASGPFSTRYRRRAALPTWDSERALEHGDLVHFDVWGPVSHGYYCDIARSTVVGGETDDAQRRLLEDSRALVGELVASVAAGRTIADVYAAGTTWLAARGEPSSDFLKLGFFGHSLGLEVEAPLIVAGEQMLIVPGMVLALETFLTEDGVGGAGYEHIVAVGTDGCEVLTAAAPDRPWQATN